MKKIVLVGLCVAFSGLLMGQSQYKKMDGYVIKGVIEGDYKANKVYLVEEEEIQGKPHIVDSAEVVNNQYTFQGPSVKYPRMYFIKSADPDCLSPITPFFLENGEISIRANADFFLNSTAKGTPNNDIFDFYKFLDQYVTDSIRKVCVLERMLYGEQPYEVENKNFKERGAIAKRRNTEIGIKMVNLYPDQAFAPFVIYWSMRYRLPLEELKALRAKIDPSLNEHPYTKQLEEYIRLAAFSEGSDMPDFTLPDQNGKKIKLSDFRGKYVYIDLWATWCGPCRREMPFLKQLEEEYKGRNITFLSLSTDARKADWLKMVKSHPMTGMQLFLGTGSRFQTAYKADGIPHFILLDPEGKIVNANMLRPSSPDIRSYLDRQPGL